MHSNPVWPGYMADPFALKVGDVYYAYGTGAVERHGEQSDHRVFPVLRSHDLVHWDWVGGALRPLEDARGASYWAPEVAQHDGRFYMYYSAGGKAGEHHRLRVATADSPEGPFVDTGRLLLPDEPFSIDAHPFRDPRDGRWYVFFAKDFLDGDRPGTGTAVAPLSEDMLSVAGPHRTVVRASHDWQIFERNRYWYDRVWPAWHTVEGPTVRFHEDRYYCLYSGGCWHSTSYGVGFGVADDVMGPYVDDTAADGPVVLKGVPGEVIGPGHNSVADGPDGLPYVVYHAWDANMVARRMFIDPLVWTPDGPRCLGPTYGQDTME